MKLTTDSKKTGFDSLKQIMTLLNLVLLNYNMVIKILFEHVFINMFLNNKDSF